MLTTHKEKEKKATPNSVVSAPTEHAAKCGWSIGSTVWRFTRQDDDTFFTYFRMSQAKNDDVL